MTKVSDILKNKKSNRVIVTAPDGSVFEAIKKMEENNIGALLVVSDNTVKGLVTERDYARKIVLGHRSSKTTTVDEIMQWDIRCVSPDVSIDQCRRIMTEQKLRYLPVVENDNLIGILSLGDIIEFMIEEKEFLIDQLTTYITGTPINVNCETHYQVASGAFAL